MNKLIKNGDIITAQEIKKLIELHGVGLLWIDDSMPRDYDSIDELELEESDKFKVSMNYSHNVQFNLIDSDFRAMITTGLQGYYDEKELDYVADAEKVRLYKDENGKVAAYKDWFYTNSDGYRANMVDDDLVIEVDE